MNRIDRLNAIRILLESRNKITAREIAEHFGLSLRTVYRDIKSLQEAGIEITGEAGMGYSLTRYTQLVPVHLTTQEAVSLLVAAKFVGKYLDAYHTKEFLTAITKMRTTLPASEKFFLESLEQKIAVDHAWGFKEREMEVPFLHDIQKALIYDEKLLITYHANSTAQRTERVVVPIGILHYSNAWHMISWCTLRKDYRDFRVDRILTLVNQGAHEEKCKIMSLSEYVQQAKIPLGEPEEIRDATLGTFVIRFSPDVYTIYQKQRNRWGFVRQYIEEKGKYAGWAYGTFYFDNSEEIARWVVSFTGGAQAVEDDWFVRECKELRGKLVEGEVSIYEK